MFFAAAIETYQHDRTCSE